MRTESLSVLVTAAGFAATLLAPPPAPAEDAVTLVSWGGAYTKSQVEAYVKPYTTKTGIQFSVVDYNGGLAELKAQVDTGNVVWDVVDLELQDVVRGCDEGLLLEIDHSTLPPAPDGTPAADDFVPGTLHECGVGNIVWSNVVAYDVKRFPGAKPRTIADFFDVERFPGKRGVHKVPGVNIEWALMADGVPAARVYEVMSTPEGIDRAFRMLDRLKPVAVWWEAGAQPPQLLADGEVAMTTAYNGRLYNAIVKEGQSFAIIWDGQVWNMDLFGIPKGAPHADAALAFVRFATDTQRLADQTKWISYGPARRSSVPLIAPAMRPHMPTAPANFANALAYDQGWWADHQDELNDRFATWLAK